MPRAKSICGLQSVVVGCPNTIFLQDVPGVRVLPDERTYPECIGCIYIGHNIQLAAFAAYIAELDDRCIAQALFHLETIAVKIRSAEILVDSIRREGIRAAVWVCRRVEGSAGLYVRKNRACCVGSAVRADRNGLNCLPVIASGATNICAVVRNRVWPNRVILQAVGGIGWWPKIQKRIDVDLVIINTKTTANDHIALGLVCESQPRRKVIAVRRENVIDSGALDHQSLARYENRQVLIAAVQRSKVLVPHTVIDAQLLGPLPGILEVKIQGIYVHRALRISHGNRGCRNLPSQVIRQRKGIRTKIGNAVGVKKTG